MRVAWIAVLWGLLCAGALAVAPQEVANPRARNGTWVTDMVGGLRADTVAALREPDAGGRAPRGARAAPQSRPALPAGCARGA